MMFRIKPKIKEIQNNLQRGFTENTTPLYWCIHIGKKRRENIHLKTEAIFVLLDVKSAIDDVRHSNLIRKLDHIGVTEQIILND